MQPNTLVFQTSPVVTIATNTFVGVPVILKYENTNLIEIIREESIGFTTQIPIYNQDGTYLAKVVGTRMFPTEQGKKAGIKIEKDKLLWACSLNGKTLFEIRQLGGDSFRTSAELYTPDGYLVKCTDLPKPEILDINGNQLRIGGLTVSNCVFQACKVGIWINKTGYSACVM